MRICSNNCQNLDSLDLRISRISPHNHVNPSIRKIMVLTMILTMAATAMAQTTVTDFAQFQDAVAGYATATENVTIEVDDDIKITSLVSIPANANGATLTIKSASPASPATLKRGASGDLFTININARLILADIIIDGDKNGSFSNGNGSLIRVSNAGAIFTMNSGTKIINNANNNTSSYGGGVYVTNGIFTMEGGEISGNTSNTHAGGVYAGGTFTMKGGEISGNTASGSGDGVYVYSGNFTMTDGAKIRNNTGAGVFMYTGDVIMNGGEISGNSSYGMSKTSGTFTINSGVVAGTGTSVTSVINGSYTLSPAPANGIIIAWNKPTGTIEYLLGSTTNIVTNPITPTDGITAVWAYNEGKSGIAYANGTNTGFIEISGITLNKADPTYTIPTGLTATYGDMLSSVELPARWSWDATESVGNAGTRTHKATFTPTDTENYNVMAGIDIDIEVAQAAGDFATTSALTATYSPTLKLSDVAPPANYAWNAPATTITSAGDNQPFAATFTDPSGNYEPATGSISVNVAKATYDMGGITFAGKTVTYDGNPQSIEIGGTLPTGVNVSYTGNGETNF
ncbi:MAG: hypothetical protein LBB36_03205, partial [Fibromonadaceae bacterium]|nr:hypothetical protein [Fibromonadaceae bacterium]